VDEKSVNDSPVATVFEIAGLAPVSKLALIGIADASGLNGHWPGDLAKLQRFTGLRSIAHEVRNLIDLGLIKPAPEGGFTLHLDAAPKPAPVPIPTKQGALL
jgi:hypothetical protein